MHDLKKQGASSDDLRLNVRLMGKGDVLFVDLSSGASSSRLRASFKAQVAFSV